MNDNHAVISAFLDDETFDPEELGEALSDPEGRALLIDAIVLRRIVQPSHAVPPIPTRRMRPSVWRLTAAAAVVALALAGGYVAGQRERMATPAAAPPPTRVVQAVPFVPAGGLR